MCRKLKVQIYRNYIGTRYYTYRRTLGIAVNHNNTSFYTYSNEPNKKSLEIKLKIFLITSNHAFITKNKNSLNKTQYSKIKKIAYVRS